jgi:hypothetical protein
MNELDLATRMRQAVADAPVRLDLHAVVAAGRRRRRARAVAASGGLALAVALVAAVAAPALVDRGGRSDRVTVASPVDGGPTAAAQEPPVDPLHGLDLSVASAAQAAEIADRAVTAEDYRAAYGRYRGCMSAGGYELEVMPPVLARGVHSFSVPDEAVRSGVDGECYDREFRFTDLLWQGSPAVQHRSEGTERLLECLHQRGVQHRPSAAEVVGQDRAAGTVDECLAP